ncbi:MAG: GIY-YIG nuclease family protein [Armatimonadota bacterium]|nr:GIY-YIG nuclease family protein [Armatimonadota bacterium]
MTGSYVLILRLDAPAAIRVGALGEVAFEPGAYAYVGSAMGGLEARIDRHLRGDKRMHWHIDYLLAQAQVVDVVRVESDERLECRIASALAAELGSVPGFGCSDCACGSHLFVGQSRASLREAVAAAVHTCS